MRDGYLPFVDQIAEALAELSVKSSLKWCEWVDAGWWCTWECDLAEIVLWSCSKNKIFISNSYFERIKTHPEWRSKRGTVQGRLNTGGVRRAHRAESSTATCFWTRGIPHGPEWSKQKQVKKRLWSFSLLSICGWLSHRTEFTWTSHACLCKYPLLRDTTHHHSGRKMFLFTLDEALVPDAALA